MREGIIYYLSDPLSPDRPAYVGSTLLTYPSARLSVHIDNAKRRAKSPVAKWIASIIAGGRRPLLRELENANEAALADAEDRWIQRFRAQGYELLNVKRANRAATPPRKALERKIDNMVERVQALRRDDPLANERFVRTRIRRA